MSIIPISIDGFGANVTSASTHLHLAVALDGAGWHPAAWREPRARPAELLSGRYWTDVIGECPGGPLAFSSTPDGFSLQPPSPAPPPPLPARPAAPGGLAAPRPHRSWPPFSAISAWCRPWSSRTPSLFT